MNRGDTIKIVLNYTVDGEPLPENFDGEIEFVIGSKRYVMTGQNPGVVWDEAEAAFVVNLSQDDTFALGGNVRYQIRIKNAEGSVVSSGIQTMKIGNTLSATTI